MESQSKVARASNGWREWSPNCPRNQGEIPWRASDGSDGYPSQAPLDLEQRFAKMEAVIQRHEEEIQRLKQQRSPVVSLPHMPIIFDSVLPAKHGMAGNQVEPLHGKIWIQEPSDFQGGSNMKNASWAESPEEIIMRPHEIMVEGQNITCLNPDYGESGRSSMIEQKRKPTSSVVGLRQNKRF